ncbi:MAG: TetR/AcrR family transcriptional regulator [Methanospirillum sp.]|uniref:TetR/AcrR family transcriptional regulator n=1 Tax=Methanospirillum sp. TaxID=45200 RepID=UPI002369D284|nr:TetR/AcrR family transcriptional regulator [Methanospirillum sp.]MDD1728139.1 TetR/AcrR family transcriptional regulator [Methanospirillum sp.]
MSMPRVVPEYKDELRKKILETATELILENGYKSVNMGDIATKAGISRPTLYLYFKDKKELFMATLKNLIEEVGSAAEDSLASDNATPDGGFFDLVTERYGTRFSIFFEIMNETEVDPQMVEEISRLHEMILKRMAIQLERRIPICREIVDPYIVANSLLALFIGLQIRKKLGLPPEKARESWNTVIKSLSNGIV